jgi:transposase
LWVHLAPFFLCILPLRRFFAERSFRQFHLCFRQTLQSISFSRFSEIHILRFLLTLADTPLQIRLTGAWRFCLICLIREGGEMVVSWKLTDSERWDLEELRRTSANESVQRNATVILLTAQGRSKERIAEAFGCSLGTVNNIRRRYRLRGLAGLEPLPRQGRRSRATPQYRAALRESAITPPQALGYGFRAWSAPRLAEHLERETGIRFGEDQLRRLLRQEGLPARLRWLARPRADIGGERRARRRLVAVS